MEFFGLVFFVKKVSCIANVSSDYLGKLEQLASDPNDRLVALAAGNPTINAISGVGKGLGQERWADKEDLGFSNEFHAILRAFKPSRLLATMIDEVIDSALEGGRFAAVHWRRGDRGHPGFLGALSRELWHASNPENLACLINAMLAKHQLQVVFIATNSGTADDRAIVRAAVKGKVVFLKDLGVLQDWRDEQRALVLEICIAAQSDAFLAAGTGYWESSTVSRLIIRKRMLEMNTLDGVHYQQAGCIPPSQGSQGPHAGLPTSSEGTGCAARDERSMCWAEQARVANSSSDSTSPVAQAKAASSGEFGEKVRAAWLSGACQQYYEQKDAMQCQAASRSDNAGWERGGGGRALPQTCVLEDLHEEGRESSQSVPAEHRPVFLAAEIVVSHEFKFVYVVVRKAASMAILNTLEQAFGVDWSRGVSCPSNTSRLHLMRAHRCTTLSLTEEQLRDYFFFTYVRDPVARFYSGVQQFASGGVGFALDLVNGPEQLAAMLTDMQRFSWVPDQHLETQAFSLSSPVLRRDQVGMINFDWIESSERLGRSFPFLLDRIEANAGKQIPPETSAKAEALANKATRKGSSRIVMEVVRSWRSSSLDDQVRATYEQDCVCFGCSAS